MNRDGLKNFKDFLLQYNKISESCFSRCINTFGQRDLTLQEMNCSDLCVTKHTQLNLKLMSVYVEIQPKIVEKRIEEMNKMQQISNPQITSDVTLTADVDNSLDTRNTPSAT